MTSVRLSRPRLASLPDSVAFWCVGGVYGVFMFAAAAPSPLYRVYAARWHFSTTNLTAVFAVYALVLKIVLATQ